MGETLQAFFLIQLPLVISLDSIHLLLQWKTQLDFTDFKPRPTPSVNATLENFFQRLAVNLMLLGKIVAKKMSPLIPERATMYS